MKNAIVFFSLGLLVACSQTENASQSGADTLAVESNKPLNCQSVVEAQKLGKSDEYRESAKPISVLLTLNQDSSAVQTPQGCYFNNTLTVQATNKSGKQLFSRTLQKDDLRYFIKNDTTAFDQVVLQETVYKPTFNAQRYIVLSTRLLEPVSKKTKEFTVYMNYFGEIVKVTSGQKKSTTLN